jgi:aryl-alcohol dehydrogenase-like predicted oxidoreductase
MNRRRFLQAAAVSAIVTSLRNHHAQAQTTNIPRRTLGRTGEKVSMVGLGGYHLGMQKDEQESIRIIRTALDGGINFLDNSWDYNDGQSEIRMGKAFFVRPSIFVMRKALCR